MQKFADKVAFVTGTGGGMGLQIASDLIITGARVLMFDIKPRSEKIHGDSSQSIYIQADLTGEPAVVSAVEKAVESFGGSDYRSNTIRKSWNCRRYVQCLSFFIIQQGVIY